jgi:hypothetical protein
VGRVEAFEWNDLAWAPHWLREGIVEILGLGLRWGKIYVPVAPIFARFLERAGTREVLDLASGSGEPCSILIAALEKQGFEPPRFTVSDLFPNVASLSAVAARHPGKIDVVERSVDATDVPPEIDRPARTIVTAFHHMSPELARKILADCVAKRRAIFIVEAFRRSFLGMLSVLPGMILGTLANPFLARRDRALKILFTFVIPLIPLAGFWDAMVSWMRIHSEAELRAMVAPLPGYQWEFVTVPFFPFGKATVWLGLPAVPDGDQRR